MVLGVNYGNNSTDPAVSSTGSLKESASADHGRIEQLWDHRFVGYLITPPMGAGIKFIFKIVFVDVTFGLCFTFESYNFENESIVNLTRSKFHGIKINGDVSVL